MLIIKNRSHLPPETGSSPRVAMPFLNYEPNWTRMEELAQKYNFIKRIILVGNGGSINTFRAIYPVLAANSTPEVAFVDTNDPEVLESVAQKSDPAKTLLLSISKSGENASQLEATLYFYQIPNKAFITGPKGALREISKIDAQIDLIDHPDIGGRFAGLSEVGLFPALLCGFNAKNLVVQPSDETLEAAWQLASFIYGSEQEEKTELLVSNYAASFSGFSLFIQQLFHETFAKKGKGVTVIPVDSPESHHHTNQRIFGGRQNMSVLFLKPKVEQTLLSIPSNLLGVKFKDKTLRDFEDLDLAGSFEAEYSGVKERADELKIPNLTLEIQGSAEKEVGEYVRFWQLAAVYGAHLRGVDPFDQPDVENSKEISFKKRFRVR